MTYKTKQKLKEKIKSIKNMIKIIMIPNIRNYFDNKVLKSSNLIKIAKET